MKVHLISGPPNGKTLCGKYAQKVKKYTWHHNICVDCIKKGKNEKSLL